MNFVLTEIFMPPNPYLSTEWKLKINGAREIVPNEIASQILEF